MRNRPMGCHRKRAGKGRPLLASVSAAVLWAGLASPVSAQEADFYAGKTIEFYIGYEAGTGYDIYARLMSENIGRFIPGHPAIIPRNMPGAASMRAMNFIHEAARRDGIAWAAVDRNVAMEPLLYGNESKAPYKTPLEFNWIGSLNTEIGVAAVWHTTGIKSWEETLTRPTIVAMAGAQGGIGARALNSFLGTQFQQVCCYGGDGGQNLAIERGEVEGRVGWSWSTLKASHTDWVESGKLKLLMQVGLQKNPDIPAEVPLVIDIAKTESDKQALKIIFANQSLGRPYVMPAGVPADRLAVVRRAFVEMTKDPAFLADAAKRRLEINDPKSGEEIHQILREVYDSPADIVAAAQRAIKDGEFKMKDDAKK
jgi:tripartite-type tricarboxylate transporter receptor subunit TctC